METTDPREKRLTMVMDGNRLEIITQEICAGEWSLCVENSHGVRSVWWECFTSPDAALEAGREAIETEGVDDFISLEGFEYLT